MSGKTRGDQLADLATAINELTEPRHHTEYLIKTVTTEVPSTDGRRRKGKRSRVRERHVVTLPGLLETLRGASVPGAGDTAGPGAGGFESRPAAELEPMVVLRDIAHDVQTWARALSVRRKTLPDTMHGLVSAKMTDEQLRNLARDAERWVKRARIATGFDPEPITLADRCPTCAKRNALVVTGDLDRARCSRCGAEWTHDNIAMLAEVLRANQQNETLAVVERCSWRGCPYVGPHEIHQDGAGRTFRDRCHIDDGPWRMGA